MHEIHKLNLEKVIGRDQRIFHIIDHSFEIKPEIRLKSAGSALEEGALSKEFRYNEKLRN